MIVVSDTSALNYLILVGVEDVLQRLFGRVAVPPAVIAELLHTNAPAPVSAWAKSPPNWLDIASPITVIEGHRLGKGEREALSLAGELGAHLLLLDDRKAIAIARRMNLSTVGTLNVLELAAHRRLIDLHEVVAKLGRTTFRCRATVIEEILRRNERNQT